MSAEEFVKHMQMIWESTKIALEKAQQTMKEYADKHRGKDIEYQIGDKVMISTKNLNLQTNSKKLSPLWLGPYSIEKIILKNAVKVKLPKDLKIHPVLNVSQIKSALNPQFPNQKTENPPPVLVDNEEEYKVEKILKSRRRYRKLELLVQCKGYGEEHNSWEKITNLENAPKSIEKFYK